MIFDFREGVGFQRLESPHVEKPLVEEKFGDRGGERGVKNDSKKLDIIYRRPHLEIS